MSAELVRPPGGAPDDPATVGPVEVTGESIAEFADAIGDPHPVYRSAAAARERGHPDVIAPPTFAVRLAAQAEASVLARRPLGYDYASAVHLAQDYRHVRPIRKGDVLTATARLVQAREALGGGLVSVEVTVSAQDGTTVTVSTAQVLSRRPASEDAPASDEDPTGAAEDGRTPYQALAEFIGREDFICLGAKAALRRGGVFHRHCGELGSPSGVLDSLAGLGEFLESFEPGERSFSSFVATFDSLPDTAEQAFEDAVWGHLQGMHDRDGRRHAWNGQYDSDPASPRFAFSVQGHPFFVVGLHPGASRPSRRFRLPALVFNSHHQFNAMGRNFFKMRKKIRQRDLAFNGSANPSLLTYRDEARHYSGRMTAPEWGCPFTPRSGPNAPDTMAG
ncbi:guanitoxin biosynthesis heme-dependent pre-guanitoxin N-hydroxylase GntA [Streptomyces xanthophaeus]|uniref:guanitoxin biosynthesis heme-dependent pre-guanitoxin N-hydroxylase GntA n=1 Tax=Streptomyces xanthophaeus TaxID=67385 RepID=UPI00264A49D1|nr:guanitoxin biosynthesis heme-dependent pre-guanitoxin N-hydroxylase GntA [Streptomyces xanthophaeus]WKD33848.1 YqcI/YcgG family protein [Streptomyces xanthophaeus]